MAKFHITAKGEPGVCNAQYNCPLGGADEHYGTKQEAQQAFEAKMTAELFPAGKSKASLGMRDLNALAKVTSDNELIEEALERGSDRTFKNLAKNPHAGMHHLVRAYNSTEDPATRKALTAHEHFPVGKMSPEEFAANYEAQEFSGKGNLMKDNMVTDAHVDAVLALPKPRFGGGNGWATQDALSNPHNKLSQEKIVEIAEQNWGSLGAAMRSGRYPAERIKGLPKPLVYWGNVTNTKDQAYLDGYADWAIAHKEDLKGDAEYMAGTVARNEATSDATLRSLAQEGLALDAVYKSPNASAVTKAVAMEKSPEVQRIAKLEKLEAQFPEGLKAAITVEASTNSPFGVNRGIRDTRVQFDVAKVKELGLDSEDIHTLMGRGHYNGGSRYNAETGLFTGTVDSTD